MSAMFRTAIATAVACGCFVAGGGLSAEEAYRLAEPADDVRVFGVGMRVQVNGKLQVGVGEDKVAPLPLNVSAALSYRERRLVGLGRDALGLRSIRDYEITDVEITVSDEKTHLKLEDRLKMIVAQGRPEGVEFYSLGGPLTTNELDLLRTPADSLSFSALLPDKEVSVGESWSPPSWAVQLFAGVEAVTKAEFQCTLESINRPLARIRIAGRLEGATGGAPTKVGITGTIDYDLETESITAADVTQTEQRSVGAVSPGLDVSARIRLLRKVAQDPGRLAEQKFIDAAASEPEPSAKFLRFDSPWNLSLLHTRDWHLFHQTDKLVIFRLLDQGAFVAQCNLAAIANARPGSHTSAEEFQTDIRTALGDSLTSLESAEEIPADEGRFLYRVTAHGKSGGREMQWRYYLAADPSGRQASLQFTVDASLVERLGDRDRELVDSLRFAPTNAAKITSPTPRPR